MKKNINIEMIKKFSKKQIESIDKNGDIIKKIKEINIKTTNIFNNIKNKLNKNMFTKQTLIIIACVVLFIVIGLFITQSLSKPQQENIDSIDTCDVVPDVNQDAIIDLTDSTIKHTTCDKNDVTPQNQPIHDLFPSVVILQDLHQYIEEEENSK